MMNTFKYGRIVEHTLRATTGFLLSMHFPNAKSLSNALKKLVPNTVYQLNDLDDTKCSIFLDRKTAQRLQPIFQSILNESLYVVPAKLTCQRCEQQTANLYKSNRFLVCFACSPFSSPNGNQAVEAEREAKRAAKRALKRRSATNPRRFSYTSARTFQKSASRAA
jgi:hypothetical protein